MAVSAVCLAALAGCSNGGGGASTTPSAALTSAAGGQARITIKDFAFDPATLTVRPGAKVTVVNEDSAPHTVTATGTKSFDTGSIGPGETATFTAPSKAGSHPYICDFHQSMKGTLTVG
ncbi:cupredoxin domain-containing protein [Streptomyces sp. NPDC050636]|uniref:cupredoxin domain-containing protein n=1 Tax=Streptomyces sp. NPDC050636 TaxID=3154510 RepID=UPI0034185DAC